MVDFQLKTPARLNFTCDPIRPRRFKDCTETIFTLLKFNACHGLGGSKYCRFGPIGLRMFSRFRTPPSSVPRLGSRAYMRRLIPGIRARRPEKRSRVPRPAGQ